MRNKGGAMRKLLLIMLCFGVVGCASTINTGIGEREISPESIQKIMIGQTSKQEIIELFGNPHSISTTATGQEIYKFVYMQTNSKYKPSLFSVNMDINTTYQELNITFKGDTVIDYQSTRR